MIVAAMLTFTTHGLLMPLLGYIGPDVFLPITSALAAVAGVLLMFWQKIVGLVGRLFGRALVSRDAKAELDHLSLRQRKRIEELVEPGTRETPVDALEIGRAHV